MVKKTKRFAALAMAFAFAASGLFAKPLTVKGVDGEVTIDIPDDVYNMVSGRVDEINNALRENVVNKSQIENAANMVNEAYANIKNYIPTDSPFNVAEALLTRVLAE